MTSAESRYVNYGYRKHVTPNRRGAREREAALDKLQEAPRLLAEPTLCPRYPGHGRVVKQVDGALWCPSCGEVPGFGPKRRPAVTRRYYPDLPGSAEASLDFGPSFDRLTTRLGPGSDAGKGGSGG